MKYSTLSVLCVNRPEGANVAYELLTLSGFTGATRCDSTRVDIVRSLYATSPLVVVAEFGLPEVSIDALLEEVRSILPDSTLIVLFDRKHERAARQAGVLHDATYVSKDCLWTLATVVRHELRNTHERLNGDGHSSRVALMARTLHLLSGINCLVSTFRDREDLLRETCHLIVSVGGYAAAMVASRPPDMAQLQPVAWSSESGSGTDALKTCIEGVVPDSDNFIARALQGAPDSVWNDAQEAARSSTNKVMRTGGFRAAIALPLLSGRNCLGVLVAASRESLTVSDEELRMLRDAVNILSFALQNMQSDNRARLLSHYDPHTGFAKRALFKNRLGALLGKAGSASGCLAIVVMDVERLSLINDSFGRRVGDLLLQELASRLRQHFLADDRIAHFGGGTFAWSVALPAADESGNDAGACQLAHAITGEPFRIGPQDIPLSVRTGCVVFPDHGHDADELIRKAEVALRNARGTGERHVRYDAGKHSRQIGQLTLEHQLRRAISRNEFELYYQPKLDIATRRLMGFEALVRWRQPEGELVTPGLFLPVLESTGLIVEVGRWVIERAARDCRHWLQDGLPPARVAVNIAPAQLRDSAFVPHFLSALDAWSNEQSGLDVEITEGAFQEECPGDVRKLSSLREQGVRIAIDDFGTGYSSLSRIATLPIDVLKIDRSFIGQMTAGPAGNALVKTVINFARAFKTVTVAEGVETQDQLAALWRLGCDQSQGYLHSAPISAAACAAMLARSVEPRLRRMTESSFLERSADDSGVFRSPGLALHGSAARMESPGAC